MPNKSLSMRKIREVIRLHDHGRSKREIAAICRVSRNTVRSYLIRFERSGLKSPLPDDITDAELERRLFRRSGPKQVTAHRAVPDWAYIHRELRRKGVTLQLLWDEYREQHPEGYEYSWFCRHYRNWAGKLDLVMRQDHKAGEKLFVDYAGMTVEIVDRWTGEIREAQLFVAALGASGYTYAEVTWSQGLEDWITSHCNCFSWMGGCPTIVVPDNLRSAVTKAHKYDPDINPTYQEMADHYSVAVVPARVGKPRDKAHAELGVLLAERWILASLRNRRFFSLAEVNTEIRRLLDRLNDKPFQKLPGSRRELFEQIDRPALGPLPREPYEFAEWKRATVHIDYHVEFDKHYYSVPFALVGQEIMVRATARIVECLHKGQRVASHRRSHLRGKPTTAPEHMPEKHRRMGEWSPERLIAWAGKTGPAAAAFVERMMAARRHPQQAFRACLGIMRLGETYGDDRLDAACRRALALNTLSYRSVESILKKGLDRKKPEPVQESILPDDHGNVRGPSYYH